jgi:hypothetical protein
MEDVLQFARVILEPADIKRTEHGICLRVLSYLKKKKILSPCEVEKMLAKEIVVSL